MNLIGLAHIDWAFWAAILSGYAIPGVTSLLTKASLDGFWKGFISNVLAFISGFAATLAATPDGKDYDYKAAVLAALAVAFVVKHARENIYAGTRTDGKLQASGVK